MKKAEAIYSLYKTVATIRGDEAFDINGNVVEYDEELVQAEIAKFEYQRQRAEEYPSVIDQLDLLYHGGYDAWKASIDAVKTKYPKPE